MDDTLAETVYEPGMPAEHTLHVATTEPLVRCVRDRGPAGYHRTASGVVRTALQALIERGTVNKHAATAASRMDHG